jgi:class 3 adenylate cyclase/pimeloyl-ACP methyl ester carboxylesterase
VTPPETRYARSGDVNIAYQVVGNSGPDLVYAPAISHLELAWDSPAEARFLSRMAAACRLILFNQRGTGMSDREAGTPTLEARMDDIRAVMDAVQSERAVVLGLGDAGPLCALFAATYPERTSGLILLNSSPRFVRSPSFPWLPTRGETQRRADEFERHWGEVAFASEFLRTNNPSAAASEIESAARIFRLSVSPSAAGAYVRMNMDVDVCGILPSVRVPTLVMHRRDGGGWNVQSSRSLANLIPGARLVELPGADFQPQFGDQESLFAELEGFLDRVVRGRTWEAEPDRVLATVLFTDIVGSTAKAAELGDAAWRELLQRHHELVRSELARFRGQEMDTAGDSFFAVFDGPARAIRCAWAIRNVVSDLGIDIRAGLHAGECELLDGKVGGIAVHIGARVASRARSREILVSSTVKDLVAGSGIEFENRGAATLKDLPGRWSLYAVKDVPTSYGVSRGATD